MTRDSRVEIVFNALLNGHGVEVKTETRSFIGRVWEIGRSPFDGHVTARVVDDRGRVHYFRVDKPDCDILELRS